MVAIIAVLMVIQDASAQEAKLWRHFGLLDANSPPNEPRRSTPMISYGLAGKESIHLQTLLSSPTFRSACELDDLDATKLAELVKKQVKIEPRTIDRPSDLDLKRLHFIKPAGVKFLAAWILRDEGLLALQYPFIREIVGLDAKAQGNILVLIKEFEAKHRTAKARLFSGKGGVRIGEHENRSDEESLKAAGLLFESTIWRRELNDNQRNSILSLPAIEVNTMRVISEEARYNWDRSIK